MSTPLPRASDPLPSDEDRREARHERLRRLAAALVAGGALGLAVEVGAALMLYSGLGLLSAAGFLLGVALAAVAAGVWVGAPERESGEVVHASWWRWLWSVGALLVAAAFAALWEHDSRLRMLAVGRAAAVLLMIAWPSYCLGTLLGTLDARTREIGGAPGPGVAVVALLGAAAGVIWGGVALIPGFPAGYVLAGCAGALALASTWEMRTARL